MPLSKVYEPDQYEPAAYALWETSGAFNPSDNGGAENADGHEPYAIDMPPPNANGNLHMGHALITTLQDILIRYHRMKGRDTIYIPGADHAGFETWVVYERLLREKGRSRNEFSREDLYSQVWDFVDSQRGSMDLQLRAIGASASWDNLVFTLDEKVIKTVYGTFKRLWDEGLIYRGERIVNYSTAYATSYADIEVDHREEKGTLWRIAYPLSDGSGEIVIATTRPETMLGDTAVAVHPTDGRYADMVGKTVKLPLSDRDIPIITDDAVDRAYGTGAVKITPFHDPNDFEMGQRHDLEKIQVIGFDGTMINVPGPYLGLSVDDARKAVLDALDEEGARRGEDEIVHSVGYDYKSGLPIQPLVKDQWFLKVRPLADQAVKALEDGEISFTPQSKKTVLIDYLNNLRDWNLSRQIPWGIPIPAFQSSQDPKKWVFDERVDQPTIDIDGVTYVREEDTFDTWFSSGQWPFITTDYLTDGPLKRFYPLSVMETGFDILQPWVARMLMLGLHVTGQVPFKAVYLNGLVLDERGQKMSKSKGNVINPMELIAEYGSDAVRLGIVAGRTAGTNAAFSRDKTIAGRNFANKLWNIARFIEAGREGRAGTAAPEARSLADHWVVRQLNAVAKQISGHIESYRFAEAADALYHTVWDDVADWYIEASKIEPNRPLLEWVLRSVLTLAHPFAPFVSETIWQATQTDDTLLISSPWYEPLDCHDIAAAEFEELQLLAREARFVAHELLGKQTLVYHADSLIEDNAPLIARLAGLKAVEKTDTPSGLRLAVAGREAWLAVDADKLADHAGKLEARLREARVSAERLESRLANENYVAKAPASLIDQTRRDLESSHELIVKLETELALIRQA